MFKGMDPEKVVEEFELFGEILEGEVTIEVQNGVKVTGKPDPTWEMHNRWRFEDWVRSVASGEFCNEEDGCVCVCEETKQ